MIYQVFRRLQGIIDEKLLAASLRDDSYVIKKARLLGWIHIIALFVGIACAISLVFTYPPLAFRVGLFSLVVLGLMIIFKRRGDMVLSGNLLVGLIMLVLGSGMLETGGLFSDNILWMILCPTVAFLFSSRGWGLVWSLVVIAVLSTLYAFELYSETGYRYNSLSLDASYWFGSYLGLYIGLFGIVWVFVKGNDEILQMLRKTSAALRKDKLKIEEQNEQLKIQEENLSRSNRDLELFAYVASHDLKEPLRMINAYSQILERNLGPNLGLKDQQYMGYLRDGAVRMQTMLEDLLAYSKLGKERDAEKDVDLRDTLLMVKNNLRVRLEESAGELIFGGLPTLRGKNTHYLQVFQNLIANSLKFARPDTPPRVRITTRETDQHYIIAIEDNGIGMREEDTKAIFGVFQRLHTKDKFEGSGIGLATVKRIIDELGGEIKVTSILGEGSTFQLYFPKEIFVHHNEAKSIELTPNGSQSTAPLGRIVSN